MSAKKRIRKWPFVLGFIVIAGAVAAFVFLPQFLAAQSGSGNTTTIMTAQVTTGEVSTTVTGTGSLSESSVDVSLPYNISGYRVYVKVGDSVKEGDVLVQLTRSSITSAISSTNTQIYNFQYDSSYITNNGALERSITSYQDLLATLAALKSDYYLYAPCDGTVSAVNIAAGTSLSQPSNTNATSGTAFQITPTGKMNVSVSVDETDIGAVVVGQTANIECDALPGQTFTGLVAEVSTTADTSSGYSKYTATIEMDKAEGMIAGLSATVTITKESRSGVLTIPMAAVQQYGDQQYVYTTADSDGTLGGQTVITTGLSDGSTVEILSGLSENQTIYYIQQSSSSNSNFNMRSVDSFGGMGGMPTGGVVTRGAEPVGGSGGGAMPSGGPSGN